ncbi:alpha-(1-_3)-arabinofuranosyltransferase family protein [Streptomyces sp. NPDC058646]|uniref:alpha-(1->3)-arabinofuranosyltransferase domain-containing protein n=1 Tax=Streptomyces sp. NPDC058646 TaxID=3346574 RepID=UPI0036674DCA
MSAPTLQLPDAPPSRPRPEPRAGRRWLAAFWLLVLSAFLAAAPGRIAFDTKLAVALDPVGFLGTLGTLWQSGGSFGALSNQYVGYAFPMLPFYLITDLLQLPVWLAERLWLSLVVTAAFWGALRLAERLGYGTRPSRLLGAACYALWPVFTIVVGSTSAAALPGAVLPWVLLPLTRFVSARAAALRSALVIPLMGGVNATSVAASLLPVGLYLLSRPGGSRKWRLIAWWVPGVLLATAWWAVPLLLLNSYGADFLRYIEQASTTTATMSATELLRGAGNWVAYLHFGSAWLPAGWDVAANVLVIACSALAAALGLAGLARRDLPERRWLLLVVGTVALITLAGYGGSLGAPFHGAVQQLLDGALAPLRNIYKFQTGLALALALGLAHLCGRPLPRTTARPRLVPVLVALAVLPGLALPYLNGNIVQPGSFKALPSQWKQTAAYLTAEAPDSRALVVPADAHGLYTWGSTIDEPLDVLADSPWAQYNFVPFGQAGERRYLEAIQEALATGTKVPGLGAFLERSGVHHLVVRNDLDPAQVGYIPPRTVRATLLASGYERVTGFGSPITSGQLPPDTPVQVQGLYQQYAAVEIFAPTGDDAAPGRATTRPVADTTVVSGGPESLLQLSASGTVTDRPVILSGDPLPAGTGAALRATADGQRRSDTLFGLVDGNNSYTYTATGTNPKDAGQDPGGAPRQILPSGPAGSAAEQTTSVIEGAKSVTASSYGSWLFALPQYDPVGAFDGNTGTAWTEGSSADPVGQWLRIDFDGSVDLPALLKVTPLAGGSLRPTITKVRITTDRGSEVSVLQPQAVAQNVTAPAGPAAWVKITIEGALDASTGVGGAGFSEISIPGVKATRVLSLPAATADSYSLHRTLDLGGSQSGTTETGLNRQLTTAAGDFKVTGSAVALPGPALDALLDQVAPGRATGRIGIEADSTTSGSPRNLLDGDLTTAWIAGGKSAVRLAWQGSRSIDHLVLGAAGGLSSRPTQVQLSTPTDAVSAAVDANGLVRFAPLTTDQLTITVTATAPVVVHNPLAGQNLQLPAGLSEVHIPALADLMVRQDTQGAQDTQDTAFTLPCGKGPVLTVDGTSHQTSVSGTVTALQQRHPVTVTLCPATGSTLALGQGKHRVSASDDGALAVTDLTLSARDAGPAADPGSRRTVEVMSWSGDERRVRVGGGEASYLQVHENANSGWRATLDGKPLQSVRLDGWQQGYVVPAGTGGTVLLSYAPATTYDLGLVFGGLALLVLAGLVVVPALRRRGSRPHDQPGPQDWDASDAPRWLLGVVFPLLVLGVVGGPLALLAVPLILVAFRWPSLLPYVAGAAMAGAGLLAVLTPPSGAFSPAAEVLALLALAATLVTADRQATVSRHRAEAP